MPNASMQQKGIFVTRDDTVVASTRYLDPRTHPKSECPSNVPTYHYRDGAGLPLCNANTIAVQTEISESVAIESGLRLCGNCRSMIDLEA